MNIDPFNESTDERIIDLVQKAGLEYLFDGRSKQEMLEEQQGMTVESGNDNRIGLNFMIMEEGKNLSIGERQLICIIRAILRKNKIVILDEATANIDVVTEQTIQRLIDEEFQDATVICIAHRLNTIIRSDMVLVMGDGRMLEYDTPQNLMANPNSTFGEMLQEKKRQLHQ